MAEFPNKAKVVIVGLGGIVGASIAHHLIEFARAATSGRQNASNYSVRLREAAVPAE